MACLNNFFSLGSLLTVTVIALSGAVCKYMYATLVGGLCGSSSENPATVGMRDSLSRVQGHLAFCQERTVSDDCGVDSESKLLLSRAGKVSNNYKLHSTH